jgi:hypothetical protein
MTIKKIKIAFAAIAAASMLAAIPQILHAQPNSATEPNDISSASSTYSSTSVFVGGTSIMRVRFGAAGYTPEQRAAHIQARVNKLLGQGPIYPSDITVSDIDANDSAVYVKGQLLFTADQATAQYNTTSAHNLAEQWAATMRQVLPDLTKPTG